MTRLTSMLTSVRLDEKSPAACALTSWRDRIHLFWAGTDAKLNLTSSPDGRRFVAPQRFPYRTYSYDKSSMDDSFSDMVFTAPALVGAPDRLYLTWMGDGAALTLLVADGRAFFGPTVFKHRSRDAPAVSMSRRGAPVLAWLGKRSRVTMLTLDENRSSMEGPALCGHRGTQGSEARTTWAPAVCSHQGRVLLAWTGTDQRVNLLTVAENRVTTPIRLEEARTNHAPAVCSHRGRLILAWVGTDTHLNVADVPVT